MNNIGDSVKSLVKIREALWGFYEIYNRLEGVINDLAAKAGDKEGAYYETPHSIVYTVSGEVMNCGPFKTEMEALKYVDGRRRKDGGLVPITADQNKTFLLEGEEAEVDDWEFDLAEQSVYLIYPSHRQILLSDADFNGFQSDS